MPRFLHTADWQIGRQYNRFDEEDASVLADARFVAIERLATLATEEQVDAVLVAGDVFDSQTLSDRALHRSFQAMAGYAGPWILIPGNHDAALAESVWTRAQRLNAIPDNAHVLLQPVVAEFSDLGFAVLPAPLTQRRTHDDLTVWFDSAETSKGLLRIGLAHGSVQGVLPEAADSSNPIAEDRATSAQLDYLALGDWHGCKQINTRTWYSGTPEPERFKDNDPGQCLIVDIEKPGANPIVQPHTVGQHAWLKLHHTLAVPTDLDQLLGELQQLAPKSVVDLTVDGQLDLAGHERLQHALVEAAGRHRSLQVHTNGLRIQPTDDDIAALKADGYVAEVVDELRKRQGDGGDEQDVARDALVILAGLLRERGAEVVE